MTQFTLSAMTALAFLTLTQCPPSFAQADSRNANEVAHDDPVQMSEAELQQRGKDLRAAIDKRYQELLNNHQLGRKAPIDDVIKRYITSGMSFEDVEAILEAAGIKYRVQNQQTTKRPFLSASLDMPSSWILSLSHTDLGITVFPKIDSDFHSGVGEIRAAIYSTDL